MGADWSVLHLKVWGMPRLLTDWLASADCLAYIKLVIKLMTSKAKPGIAQYIANAF